MALASELLPSDGRSRYLKYMALLVDGGTMMLRHQLKSRTAGDLATHLKTTTVKTTIKQLVNKRVISNDQKKTMLYPTVGQADLSKLDMSLLSCLLRNVCDLDGSLPVWDPRSPPGPTDTSVEADIARLRNLRNKHAHATSALLTEQEFQQTWTELEEILNRLGAGIPDLQRNITELKAQSIDSVREKELLAEIEAWESMDRSWTDKVTELSLELDNQSTEIKDLSTDVSTMKTDIDQIKKAREDDDIHETLTQIQQGHEETQKLKKTVKKLETSQKGIKRDVRGVKKEQQNQMSSELKSLLSISNMYMEESKADNTYIRTTLHQAAMGILKQNRLLVLSGLPGEGKTTMALKLASEIADPSKCLILRDPQDWTHVDLSLDKFETLLVDDIFGAGVMDQRMAKKWEKYLPQMCKAVEKKSLYLIVTTRHYILEEAKRVLRNLSVFKEDHVLTLSSACLQEHEKEQILKAHLNEKGKEFEIILIGRCIFMSNIFTSQILENSEDFLFGFPQCVEMFVSNEQLYERGAEFFSKPNEFLRKSIEDVKRDKKKFFALILIWSRNGKPLKKSELVIDGSISKELETIARKFGFQMKPGLVKLLRQSVDYHTGGFVEFNSTRGTYTLSHHVVEDIVGLVASEDYPDAVLEYSSRDFLLEYVTIDKSNVDKYHFYLDEYMFVHLSGKLLGMMLTPPPADCKVNVKRFKSSGNCPNKVTPMDELDSELVLLPFFKNAKFVTEFASHLCNEANRERASKLLGTPVLTMSGYFLKHGICLDETNVYLAQFSLLHEYDLLPTELIRQRVAEYDKDLDISLMIAAHNSQTHMVQCLLQAGAAVTEDAIYIAAVNRNTEIITTLMKNAKQPMRLSRICNGNSALLVSAKKGLVESVTCLVQNGADVQHRNKDGLCALDKAIINEHVEISKLLIDAGSPLNERSGKFKRTPMHLAADIGLTEVVSHLLSKPFPVLTTKDHKGHNPLQCAAIQGHTEIVKLILEHNNSLAKQRLFAYGKNSPFRCGMTVFHIAVWKQNLDLLNTLVDMKLDANVPDVFGRTALYRAAYDGKIDLVKCLIPVSNVQRPEKQGFTPLHAAIHKHHNEVAKLLCPLSNINATDMFGRTPLHVACQEGGVDVINLLLKSGADYRMLTNRGRSCTEIAYREYKVSKSETHKAIVEHFFLHCKPLAIETCDSS